MRYVHPYRSAVALELCAVDQDRSVGCVHVRKGDRLIGDLLRAADRKIDRVNRVGEHDLYRPRTAWRGDHKVVGLGLYAERLADRCLLLGEHLTRGVGLIPTPHPYERHSIPKIEDAIRNRSKVRRGPRDGAEFFGDVLINSPAINESIEVAYTYFIIKIIIR